jgi:hypothetical protein
VDIDEETNRTVRKCMCRASPAIVDVDEESEQDGRISEQCGGRTRGKSCGISGGE